MWLHGEKSWVPADRYENYFYDVKKAKAIPGKHIYFRVMSQGENHYVKLAGT